MSVYVLYIRHSFQVIQIGIDDIDVSDEILESNRFLLRIIAEVKHKIGIGGFAAIDAVFAPEPSFFGNITRPKLIKVIKTEFVNMSFESQLYVFR